MIFETVLIVILTVLLLLSILGVNISYYSGSVLGEIWNLTTDVFRNVSYDAGEIVNAASSTVTSVAKTGIDITDGAIHDAGNLMQGKTVDQTLNVPKTGVKTDPLPSSTTSNQLVWCNVGHTTKDSSNNCVQIGSTDACATGKRFASQAACLKG